MSENNNLYAKITAELKKRTKIQSIGLGIDYQDYISLALEHYSVHVENNDLDIDIELEEK